MHEARNTAFGAALRERRIALGLGQAVLARLVPCNPGHLSHLEKGAKRASKQLAVRLDELLGADGALVALLGDAPRAALTPSPVDNLVSAAPGFAAAHPELASEVREVLIRVVQALGTASATEAT